MITNEHYQGGDMFILIQNYFVTVHKNLICKPLQIFKFVSLCPFNHFSAISWVDVISQYFRN